jgi:hypothetical protein
MPTTSPRIGRALSAALKAAPPEPRDNATVALAKRYAALMDDVERTAAELAELRADDESTAAALARLRARVDGYAVAAELGPKLLAALAALGLTPAARAVAKGGAPGGTQQSGPADALARLRERHGRPG